MIIVSMLLWWWTDLSSILTWWQTLVIGIILDTSLTYKGGWQWQ